MSIWFWCIKASRSSRCHARRLSSEGSNLHSAPLSMHNLQGAGGPLHCNPTTCQSEPSRSDGERLQPTLDRRCLQVLHAVPTRLVLTRPGSSAWLGLLERL